jgi:transposase
MRYYIGVDFHKQFSFVTVMDPNGNIMEERQLSHLDLSGIRGFFSRFAPDASVSVEATRSWYWFVDLLQDIGLSVNLVHPKKTRIIAESTIKTDKIDASVLAHLDRCQFLPKAFIPDLQSRSSRELLRYHLSLVKFRTATKNKIHALLAKLNIHHEFSDLFGKAGLEFLNKLTLPDIFRLELNGYTNLLDHLKDSIDAAALVIKNSCQQSPMASRLFNVPGLGFFSASLLAAEIADIKRFASFKKFCSYAGLAPSTHQSASTIYHGHIIKDSNAYIRYVLIEAVSQAIKKDNTLYWFYRRLAKRRGINKARVATARKLAKIIYFMLADNQDYYPNKTILRSRVSPYSKLGTAKSSLAR